MLEVTAIDYEDKHVLHNLIQLYRYDSSEFDGHGLTKHGLYLYKYLDHQWTDTFRYPLMIRVNGELAGFALLMLAVPREFVHVSVASETNVISDFFILRKFRNKGYGKQAAFQIFDLFLGAWEIRQTLANKPANQFWNRVIHDYTEGMYREKVLNEEHWTGPIQVFGDEQRT
ncbi:GNAT family N-acetyltransferase [Paenibacillus xylanilyticus]|uniref:GNAT family N-acetyltransferase n=1 Tax=Paenibacillus xylanilyticus TaxID=248903 RepID=A0A7Y6EUZ3_9BACL|nr:GNAT family N-acetyltransferase [Paenibacillus xylanilyticus]NUU77632.1 GNAT family N-acetyltransferase [Paenibacillus xylanilyticus]